MGVSAQVAGTLGTKFGLEVFSTQNVPSHTSGTATDLAGTLGDAAKGATSVTISALTDTQTVAAGDTFTYVGDDTEYAITSAATVASNAITVNISPPLQAAVTGDPVVTMVCDDESGVGMAFHRNAFALAFAPLPEMGNELGARVFTAVDEQSGLSVRARVYYMGDLSQVHVGLDTLFGMKTLDARLAVRHERA